MLQKLRQNHMWAESNNSYSITAVLDGSVINGRLWTAILIRHVLQDIQELLVAYRNAINQKLLLCPDGRPHIMSTLGAVVFLCC